MMVTVPTSEGVNDTVHSPDESTQVKGWNVPPLPLSRLMLPLGEIPVTPMLHEVDVPMVTREEEQKIFVLVMALETPSTRAPLAGGLFESPSYAAVMATGELASAGV